MVSASAGTATHQNQVELFLSVPTEYTLERAKTEEQDVDQRATPSTT